MQKKLYLTILSVISAIAVVMLHTNGCFWSFSYEKYWFTANLIESVMYFAVPIFFMITGATLLDYTDKYSTKVYFYKRFKKTVIPFVLWSFIGFLYLIYSNSLSLHEYSLRLFIEKFINCGFVEIYWFFIPLFAVYLTIPILSSIDKEKRLNTYSYLVLVCLMFNYLLPFVCKLFNINYNINMQLSIGSGYIMYICIGYIFDNINLEKYKRIFIYILGFIGFLFVFVGTYILSIKSGTIVSTFKGYQNLPCLLYSISIFLMIKNISVNIKNDKIIHFMNWLSKYTFSLYLTHWFIIRIIINIFSINTLSIVYRIFAPFLILIINIFITYFVRKVPLGKILLP